MFFMTFRGVLAVGKIHALSHVSEIKVEHTCSEWGDQRRLGHLAEVFLRAFAALSFLIVAQVRLFFIDERAYRLDLLFADIGLVQAVGADRGLKIAVELSGECGIE